jgi:hypothetical protein
MVRTELRIQEIATLMHTSSSRTADEVAAAGISHGTCHEILSDYLQMYHVTQLGGSHILTQDQRDDLVSTCCDPIDSADKDGIFLNQIITGDNHGVCVWSATEAIVGHLAVTIITKREETTTEQVKRQGNA